MAVAIRDLATLLAGMKPILRDGTFGYCCLPAGVPIPAGFNPVLTFVEDEGTTIVVPLQQAQAHGLDVAFPARMITLDVTSALDAVGFLAAICARLAAAGISVNAVSAYHHDHLFVPADRAAEALRLLAAPSP